jgi:hypothetical protein
VAFEQFVRQHVGQRDFERHGSTRRFNIGFGGQWQAGFLPGRQAAGQGARLRVASLSQFVRHTGAGLLVPSGTVQHDPLLR